MKASAAHGPMFCSSSLFYHWNRNLCTAKEKVYGVKGDVEGGNKMGAEVSEVRDQALLYIKHPLIYNRDPRRKDLLHASVSKKRIYFWKEKATWETMLHMVDYIATADIACQHPGGTNAMTKVSRVTREEAPCRVDPTKSRGEQAI